MAVSAESIKQYRDLVSEMDIAVTEGRHEEFEALDVRCRDLVSTTMQKASDDDHELRDQLQRILSLYKRMVSLCSDQRQDSLQQIRQMHKGQKGVQAYRNSAMQR